MAWIRKEQTSQSQTFNCQHWGHLFTSESCKANQRNLIARFAQKEVSYRQVLHRGRSINSRFWTQGGLDHQLLHTGMSLISKFWTQTVLAHREVSEKQMLHTGRSLISRFWTQGGLCGGAEWQQREAEAFAPRLQAAGYQVGVCPLTKVKVKRSE